MTLIYNWECFLVSSYVLNGTFTLQFLRCKYCTMQNLQMPFSEIIAFALLISCHIFFSEFYFCALEFLCVKLCNCFGNGKYCNIQYLCACIYFEKLKCKRTLKDDKLSKSMSRIWLNMLTKSCPWSTMGKFGLRRLFITWAKTSWGQNYCIQFCLQSCSKGSSLFKWSYLESYDYEL